jgi:tRNA (guanine37-N1)-methyltransferase
VIVDAVARFVPGVVGDEHRSRATRLRAGCWITPQYTRPAEFRRMSVPPVLLSGHHAEIEKWRARGAAADARRRPDLIERRSLDAGGPALLQELLEQGEKGACNDCR